MRLARLIYDKNGTPEARYYHPGHITGVEPRNNKIDGMMRRPPGACVAWNSNETAIHLLMPLDEAVAEINAAMNDNPYEEAFLQGIKLQTGKRER